MVDSPTESNNLPDPEGSDRQPRDSRLESFLRQAEGILAAQGQWNAATQVKLKTLANELKLPLELFASALEQLGDPNRRATVSRWEQAFSEYLEQQFQRLPGGILSLPKERKAKAYGQQKFQLTPDTCERVLTEVANRLQIARISDAQTVDYARSEIKRLVATGLGKSADLPAKIQDLSERLGLDEKQAERLLTTELNRLAFKKRRLLLQRLALQCGTLMLSVTLIVCIIWLGRILTRSPGSKPEQSAVNHNSSNIEKLTESTTGRLGNVYPQWWSTACHEFADLISTDPQGKVIVRELNSQQPDVRRAGYLQLWELLGQWDHAQLSNNSDQPRWLRQPAVQEAMLHLFANDPDIEAVEGWLDGANQLRWPAAIPDFSARKESIAEVGLSIMGRFLNAVAADNLLLRAIQQVHPVDLPNLTVANERPGVPSPTQLDQRQNLLRRRLPEWSQFQQSNADSVTRLETLRSHWLAQHTERFYLDSRQHWPVPAKLNLDSQHDIHSNGNLDYRSAFTSLFDVIQMEPDPNRRLQFSALAWAGLAGFEANTANIGLKEIEDKWSELSPDSRLALIESWSAVPENSPWQARLSERFLQVCEESQTPLSNRRAWDAVLIQRTLGCRPVPSIFQTNLRRQTVLGYLASLDRDSETTSQNLESWEVRSHAITLALAVALELPYEKFDAYLLQVARTSKPQTDLPHASIFVSDEQFDSLWSRVISTNDLTRYREAVGGVVELFSNQRLMTERQTAIVLNYLANELSTERRAAWLLTADQASFNTTISSQLELAKSESRSSLRLLGHLVQQPTFAFAMARLLNDYQANETELEWLPPETAQSLDATTLRLEAFARLNRLDWEHELTEASRLAKLYRNTIDQRSQMLGFARPQSSNTHHATSQPLSDSDWLTNVLLDHNELCQTLAKSTKFHAADWYRKYEQSVNEAPNAVQALEIAEESLLQYLRQHLERTQ